VVYQIYLGNQGLENIILSENPLLAYSVEKLQIFLVGEFISDITIIKI